MDRQAAVMDRAGRVVIPAELRRQMGFKEGDELLFRVSDTGTLEVYTLKQAIREAQEYFSQFKRPGVSVVDEFLAERRREAEAEFAD